MLAARWQTRFGYGIGEWWPLKGTNFSYGGERADKIFLEAKPAVGSTGGSPMARSSNAVARVSGWAKGWQYILARYVEAGTRAD